MSRAHAVLLAVAGSALLSGCAAAERAMPGTLSQSNVVALFDTIDKNEIEAAQLATQKASSPAVRDYAERMMSDHTAMLEKRRQLITRLNIQPESPRLAWAMTDTHRETLGELRKKSGQEFDQAYLKSQVAMHEQAIKLALETSASAGNSRLKQHLMDAGPELHSHLVSAKLAQRQAVAQQQ